jgi:hypothetical protein
VLSTTSRFSIFLKPESSTLTTYIPGGIWASTNEPCGLDCAVCVAARTRLTAVTVAPGSIAPLASLTVPVIVPALWANVMPVTATTIAAATSPRAMSCDKTPP